MENVTEIKFLCPFCNEEIVVNAPISLNINILPNGNKSLSVSAQTVANHECL